MPSDGVRNTHTLLKESKHCRCSKTPESANGKPMAVPSMYGWPAYRLPPWANSFPNGYMSYMHSTEEAVRPLVEAESRDHPNVPEDKYFYYGSPFYRHLLPNWEAPDENQGIPRWVPQSEQICLDDVNTKCCESQESFNSIPTNNYHHVYTEKSVHSNADISQSETSNSERGYERDSNTSSSRMSTMKRSSKQPVNNGGNSRSISDSNNVNRMTQGSTLQSFLAPDQSDDNRFVGKEGNRPATRKTIDEPLVTAAISRPLMTVPQAVVPEIKTQKHHDEGTAESDNSDDLKMQLDKLMSKQDMEIPYIASDEDYLADTRLRLQAELLTTTDTYKLKPLYHDSAGRIDPFMQQLQSAILQPNSKVLGTVDEEESIVAKAFCDEGLRSGSESPSIVEEESAVRTRHTWSPQSNRTADMGRLKRAESTPAGTLKNRYHYLVNLLKSNKR